LPTLNWIGKKAVENHHHMVPFHLLKDVPEFSVGNPGSGNLLVEGDNLLALKALLPYYAGQVKCVFIDPPYNTGNENWIYNDAVNSPEMKSWLGKVVGNELEDLTRHDKWLCMMYPRLALLRKFLRRDGILFMTIDDAEIENALFLGNEIFGRNNNVATIIWQHSVQPKGYSGKVSIHHNYLIAFSKSDGFIFNDIPRKDEHNLHYSNPDNDPEGPWRSGDVRNALYRPNLIYDLKTPSGKVIKPPPKGWRWSKETMAEKIRTGEILFRSNETKIIRKIYLKHQDGRAPESIWFGEDVGTTREANQELKDIFDGQSPFDTPKPVRLLERILQIATKPGDIILDSFAGSGTTGHAAFSLFKNGDDRRKFILIEMEAKIAREITAKRLSRIAVGYKNPKGEKVAGIGDGFRFATLGDPLFDERGNIRSSVRFTDLARHVYFTETGEPLSKQPKAGGPLLGIYNNFAVYLLYNGILKDISIDGGNVLTTEVLRHLPQHDGLRVIYGTACRLGAERLRRDKIIFKQLPYKLRLGAL